MSTEKGNAKKTLENSKDGSPYPYIPRSKSSFSPISSKLLTTSTPALVSYTSLSSSAKQRKNSAHKEGKQKIHNNQTFLGFYSPPPIHPFTGHFAKIRWTVGNGRGREWLPRVITRAFLVTSGRTTRHMCNNGGLRS